MIRRACYNEGATVNTPQAPLGHLHPGGVLLFAISGSRAARTAPRPLCAGVSYQQSTIETRKKSARLPKIPLVRGAPIAITMCLACRVGGNSTQAGQPSCKMSVVVLG